MSHWLVSRQATMYAGDVAVWRRAALAARAAGLPSASCTRRGLTPSHSPYPASSLAAAAETDAVPLPAHRLDSSDPTTTPDMTA